MHLLSHASKNVKTFPAVNVNHTGVLPGVQELSLASLTTKRNVAFWSEVQL